jgi:hypothetical protein
MGLLERSVGRGFLHSDWLKLGWFVIYVFLSNLFLFSAKIDTFVKELPTFNLIIGQKQSPKKVYNLGFTI